MEMDADLSPVFPVSRADFSLEDIQQDYQFRAELVGFAAQLVREAGRPNNSDIRYLREALKRM